MTQVAYHRKPPVSLARAHWAIPLVLGVLAVAGMALLSALVLFDVPEPERFGVTLAMMCFLFLPLSAGFAALFSKLVKSPGRDLLQLDDEGLGWKTTSADRHWRWRELSAFEVYHRGPGSGFIWFSVPEDESRSGHHRRFCRVARGRSEVRIQDIYDRPLDEITAELNARRRGAVAIEDDHAAVHDAEQDAAITYLARAGHAEMLVLKPLMAAFLVVWLFRVVPFSWLAACTVLTLLLGWFLVSRMFPSIPPMDNFLRLDAEGLTVTCRGKDRRWSWSEISAVRQRGTTGPASKFWGGLITFEVPDDARQSALWRWLSKRLFGRPLAVIADIYLAPLDEIVGALNDYQGRALAAGPGTG